MDDTRAKTGDIIASLFHQDPLSSVLFSETTQRKTQLEPEKLLMLAVLEDAVCCLKKNLRASSRKGRRLMRETEEWIQEEDGERLFSFNNICEVLGLDPRYLRRGLMRWKQTTFLEPRAPKPLGRERRARKTVKSIRLGIAA